MSETTEQPPQPDPVTGKKPKLDLTGAEWLSSDEGNGDVQIAFVQGYIAMRNGRDPDGPALIFTQSEWDAFVLGARDGEFDID
ncbi:DUF397 domain-containing protein [Allostreptomyces psammosilenae]|uniref:DUF397 domain-containing protein n=1 Tax=Allostreptomyces psammosilenae TaxID=1892865 RepID=A0A852ZZA4_9ACTN|nr:DUF397 domain-containing protein [Allostreptomyces psammosilenae]NYI07479.1 hypothetical protein [Allostreptomyces psammosilenae]